MLLRMRPSYVMTLKELLASDNRCFNTSMIGAVKVEHDYEMMLVPKSDQNRSENHSSIVSESLTLTVTNGRTSGIS
jgi:hypothetical protein